MNVIIAMLLLLTAAGCGGGQTKRAETNSAVQEASMDYLGISLQTIAGDTTTLAAFTGRVVLLVNVASKCGHTPQYAGLEALYRRYKDRGFVVIGFPANNFKNQEPGTPEEILAFCRANYDVTFPLMAKLSVQGEDQHPLYRYLTADSPFPGAITWNFNKFLLDRTGRVVARFDTKTAPQDKQVIGKIEELLALQ